MNMWQNIVAVANGRLWWWLMLVLGAAMIGIALFYQYVFEEWPCVLCIHVRLLFLALMVVSLLALILFRFGKMRVWMHVWVAVISLAMINRAWVLLATERGWLEGECSISLGLPAWFALDQWLPSVFSAWTTCGYTPVIALGITMAELIMLFAISLFISAMTLIVATLRKPG